MQKFINYLIELTVFENVSGESVLKNAIKNPITIILIIIVLAVLGVVSIFGLDVDITPDLSLPQLLVVTPYLENNVNNIENEIVKPLMSLFNSVDGVQSVSCEISQNLIKSQLILDNKAKLEKVKTEVKNVLELQIMKNPLIALGSYVLDYGLLNFPESGILVSHKSKNLKILKEEITTELLKNKDVSSVEFYGLNADKGYLTLNNLDLKKIVEAIKTNLLNLLKKDEITQQDYDSLVKEVESIATFYSSFLNTFVLKLLVAFQSAEFDLGNIQIDGVKFDVELDDRFENKEDLLETPIIGINFKEVLDKNQDKLDKLKDIILTENEYKDMLSIYPSLVLSNLFKFSSENNGYILNNETLNLLKKTPVLSFSLAQLGSYTEIQSKDMSRFTIDGNEAMYVVINRKSNVSSNSFAKTVIEELESFKAIDKDFLFEKRILNGQLVDNMLKSIMISVCVGLLFIFLLLAFAYKNLKLAFIISVSIIISYACSLVFLFLLGVNINILTLIAITVTLGMVVDNSIVTSDNIMRLRGLGEDKLLASIIGSKQMFMPIFISTLTTIIVFVPAVFVSGTVAKVLYDFGITMAVSLLSGLFAGAVVTPTFLAYQNFKKIKINNKTLDKITCHYEKSLKFCVKNKYLSVVLSLVSIVCVVVCGVFMPKQLMPPIYGVCGDVKIQIYEENINGLTKNEALDIIYYSVKETLKENSEITAVSMMPRLSNAVGYTIENKDDRIIIGVKKKLTTKIINNIDVAFSRVNLPKGAFSYSRADGISTEELNEGYKTVKITGTNINELIENLESMEKITKENKVKFISKSYSKSNNYVLELDKNKLSKFGVTSVQAGLEIKTLLNEKNSLVVDMKNSTTLDLIIVDKKTTIQKWYTCVSGNEFIRVYFDENKFYFLDIDGEKVELVDFNKSFSFQYNNKKYSILSDKIYYKLEFKDDIDFLTEDLSMIVNKNTPFEKLVSFKLYEILSNNCFEKDDEGKVAYRLGSKVPKALINKTSLNDYSIDRDGYFVNITLPENELNKIANVSQYHFISFSNADNGIKDLVMKDLTMIAILAIIFVLAILIASLKSFVLPLIIFISLPFALLGAFIAVLILGQSISIITLISIILLIGVVANNGIVFVDYAEKLRQTTTEDVVLKSARDRFKPIILTAFTTIFALVVMLFDNSNLSAIFKQVSLVTILGLLFSTLSSLYVLPTIYNLYFKYKSKIAKKE